MANRLKVLISIALLTLLIILGWQWVHQSLSAEPLSESDVREKVQTQYNGEITDVTSMEDHYLATIALDEGVYEVVVIKTDGRISEIRPLESFKDNDSPSPPEDKFESAQTEPITEEKAKAVALNEIEGEVDDIDFESEEEPAFYLVEIERSGGAEATVQVHALTGEIMSVTWDD
ncbi:PepSY domain-containing protein [Halobacillus sp. HZG1]|uniref:PepSY domain-containing protein n=1 Tax=Halobacillus sp. HZG1 TaxID=3111769 RepID=UPI002DBD6970|nr:PepSY domain-containing protein [Halobacillus sp. HZG1]MEC3883914.1 PepSY domain-containing protein [Halobacillus sp. HZG1]